MITQQPAGLSAWRRAFEARSAPVLVGGSQVGGSGAVGQAVRLEGLFHRLGACCAGVQLQQIQRCCGNSWRALRVMLNALRKVLGMQELRQGCSEHC